MSKSPLIEDSRPCAMDSAYSISFNLPNSTTHAVGAVLTQRRLWNLLNVTVLMTKLTQAV